MLDLEGNEKLNFADSHFGEREPVYDLYKREIALSPGTGIESYPCEVIDMNTGKTKFKLGPIRLPENQSVLPPGFIFLPVGRDDLYVLGLGGTLCLRRYGDQKDIWKIDYIGGNFRKGEFLKKDILAVYYFDIDKPGKGESRRGLLLIDLKKGKILFRKEGFKTPHKSDDWFRFLFLPKVFLKEDGSLCLVKGDRMLVLPQVAGKKYLWAEERARKLKAVLPVKIKEFDYDQADEREKEQKAVLSRRELPPVTKDGRYWVRVEDKLIRVNRTEFIEVKDWVE
ncbi:MAG: hypothetical protein QME28_09785 [Candidatus Saccharicenans sp.]|nr:hypothetical protein [Candidatus Saccharicenans sp.]